jgi:hypothetical protein
MQFSSIFHRGDGNPKTCMQPPQRKQHYRCHNNVLFLLPKLVPAGGNIEYLGTYTRATDTE